MARPAGDPRRAATRGRGLLGLRDRHGPGAAALRRLLGPGAAPLPEGRGGHGHQQAGRLGAGVADGFLQDMKGDGATATEPFPDSTTKDTTDMAPFILAAIPSLIQAAPSLIRLFGNGEQSEKNAKAAEIAVEIAKSVTEQPTAEGAVNAIQSDPVVATAYSNAIESKWYELTGESGGGGIEGARKANAEASKKPIWTNPAFLVTLLILPMIYMTVYGVIFGDFSNDIKIMVISAVMSLGFGSVAAYYFGTSASSQKKTDMLNEK